MYVRKMEHNNTGPELRRHLQQKALLEVMNLIEQTGFWTALFLLHEKPRNQSGFKAGYKNPIGIGSNDTVYKVIENLKLLGLIDEEEASLTRGITYHLSKKGEVISAKFREILDAIGISYKELLME